MVFQSFNLFPHLTVLENAALAPVVVKRIDEEAEQQARDLLAKVGLSDRVDYYPSQLQAASSNGRDRSRAGDDAEGDAL